MTFDDIVQYRSAWSCFPARVRQVVEPMVRGAIQRRAGVQVLRPYFHLGCGEPRLTQPWAEVDALPLTLSH